MTSFVYDFKDIAARMKGELKAQPEPEPFGIAPHWRFVHMPCMRCHGGGEEAFCVQCTRCNGTGNEP